MMFNLPLPQKLYIKYSLNLRAGQGSPPFLVTLMWSTVEGCSAKKQIHLRYLVSVCLGTSYVFTCHCLGKLTVGVFEAFREAAFLQRGSISAWPLFQPWISLIQYGNGKFQNLLAMQTPTRAGLWLQYFTCGFFSLYFFSLFFCI